MSAKKSRPNLSVGSTFLAKVGGNRFPFQVEVLSQKGDDIEVRISYPARPKICDRCGHGHNLSLNGVTGVVVCMTSRCGQSFGYTTVETKKMKVSDFASV